MRIRLIANTPNVEVMVATSMLTTTSGAQPSTLYDRLQSNPEKVRQVVERLEVQHGNVLEHNRLIWLVQASSEEIMDVLLCTRHLSFNRLADTKWLMSGNLRAVVEYSQHKDTEFARRLIESVKGVAPTIHRSIRRDKK